MIPSLYPQADRNGEKKETPKIGKKVEKIVKKEKETNNKKQNFKKIH